MECATVHAVVSSARAVVSTVHGVDSRMRRGTEGFVQGMLDVGLCGLYKEMMQKVAKIARKVKEKKCPSLVYHAVGQQDKLKSEGEGQLWVLGVIDVGDGILHHGTEQGATAGGEEKRAELVDRLGEKCYICTDF